jgi:hypothetical protein
LGSRFGCYERAIKHQEASRVEFDRLQADRPARTERRKRFHDKVIASIRESRATTNDFLENNILPELNQIQLEKFIRSNFDDAKRAQESVLTRLVETLQWKTDSFLACRAEELKVDVEDYLKEFKTPFSHTMPNSEMSLEIPFDGSALFAGSVAGLAAAGALGLVASTMGNLGGYILVAKGVSLLSAFGISMGGTAAASSFVAALGGPVTLALGLAVLVGFVVSWIFGDSWQTRLAKKLEEHLRDTAFYELFGKRCDTFWTDTETGFTEASRLIEARYDAYLTMLSKTIAAESHSSLEDAITETEKLRDFFDAMPWRCGD